MRNKLIVAMSMVLSLGLGGVAHADSTTIVNTGPSSSNVVSTNNVFTETIVNNNTQTVSNSNAQSGTTGNAQVNDNTTGGSAMSGSVNNSNSFSTTLSVNNAGGSGGSSNTPSNIAGGGSGGGVGGSAVEQILPRTGGNSGLDMSLLDALMKARKGVIAPLAQTGANWNWALTALAGMMALAATAGYSKLSSKRLGAQIAAR